MHTLAASAHHSRLQQAALRRRLLEGCWADDAADREADFFAPEVRDMLPPAELSHNPFLTTHQQIAVLYDCDPKMEEDHAAGDPTRLFTEDLWPLCQQRLLHQIATNEAAMRLDLYGEGDQARIGYRVVHADLILEAEAPPETPQTPNYLVEARQRIDPSTGKCIWTREVWDCRNPEAPQFRIERAEESAGLTTWVDDTVTFAKVAGWPDAYRNRKNEPVFPYVLYHRRFGSHLWDPMTGYELVLGTLTVAACWTMWLAGVRDGTHPQRVLLDGDAQVSAASALSGGSVQVRMNPQTILQVFARKRADGTFSSPDIKQWEPAMDPKVFGEAITDFEASLAVHAGLSPADVQRGAEATSGYAIVVSRSGQVAASRKLAPVCKVGDQLLLARAAALLNRAVGTEVASEKPQDWKLCYPALDTEEEESKEAKETAEAQAKTALLKQKAELAQALRDLGLLTQAQALLLLTSDLMAVFGPAAAAVSAPDLRPVIEELHAALAAGDTESASELATELLELQTARLPEAPVAP